MTPKTYSSQSHGATGLSEYWVLREPVDFQEPIPISERLAQALWADQLFRTEGLQTGAGEALEIITPGRWNTEGGPDFRGAQIKLNGLNMRGDVEIHLHSTGWNEHHHFLNPEYDNVVLDVCLWQTGAMQNLLTSANHLVPQLILHPFLECSLEELVESIDPEAYPLSPRRMAQGSSPLLELSPAELTSYIHAAGVARFERKVARAAEWIRGRGRRQAAYEMLSHALGYKNNKWAFRRIAQELPLSELLCSRSVDEKIEALFIAAGRHKLKLHKIRPSNHPHRRLVALALLAQSFPEMDVWFEETLQSKQIKTVPTLHHPFWCSHYSSDGEKLPNDVALLGKNRWIEILSNVILPFCAANAGNCLNTERAELCVQKYLSLPATQPILPSRQIGYDLGLPIPTRMVQQQGMIQIYEDEQMLLPHQK